MVKITKPTKKTLKIVGVVVTEVALVVAGVLGTLYVQKTVNDIKAQGVSEFKANDCEQYSKDGLTWLECDL